ncbi:MAG: hypothetical protein OEW06_04160 [Gemmatimonadota bacterium]|nr:hypothetical protein [Gemmatimonadota bacterium]MDH4349947.1 hypothetical protein [Gemmatimonadota bacterium]
MAYRVRRVGYFYLTLNDQPGEGYHLLSELAKLGINLLAFTGVPIGPQRTQLSAFPEDDAKFKAAADRAGLVVDGPHPALLVQGDDELGALAGVHERLRDATVNVYASHGVTDGKGTFGYVLYVRPDQYEQAVRALGV